MDLGLDQRIAIITGGASGLGFETAKHLAEEGVKLLLADLNEGLLAEAAASLRKSGAVVSHAVVDVRDYAQCERMVAQALDEYGQVDALINSAGVGGPFTFFAETPASEWDDMVAINLMGVLNCCRAVTDTMTERRYGKIVSLASEAGKGNEKRMAVYGMTKGGVISLTRGLAVELGRYSINVNCVCPGVTKTPMTAYIDEAMEREASRFYPLGRLGEPQDIAPMIAFLCSDKTSWVTGQAISINGGFGRS